MSEIPNAKPSRGVLKLMSSCFLPRADAAVRFVVALMSSSRSNRVGRDLSRHVICESDGVLILRSYGIGSARTRFCSLQHLRDDCDAGISLL